MIRAQLQEANLYEAQLQGVNHNWPVFIGKAIVVGLGLAMAALGVLNAFGMSIFDVTVPDKLLDWVAVLGGLVGAIFGLVFSVLAYRPQRRK